MSAPSKKKQAQMADRRNKALAYMQEHGSVTVNEIARHLELSSLVVNHTVTALIYGGAVEHDGTTYIPNKLGKKTRVCKYKLTGKAFDSELAHKTKHEKHDPKPQEETPGVRRITLLDKPCRRNQEGQGSGHHRVFIGSSRGW